jgi:hypothetical protein
MQDSWWFDLEGEKRDMWVWRHVGPDGAVLARSESGFGYYLDAVADARHHGFSGTPKFGKPPSRRDESAG